MIADDAPRRIHELQRIAKAMRRLSYWAGIYAIDAQALAAGLEAEFSVLFPARPQRRAHPRLAVGSVLSTESSEELSRCGYQVLSALWARMLLEASWQPWDRGEKELKFKVLSRRAAWKEGRRQVMAFGPHEGRVQRLRELKGHVHAAFSVLGFHAQPRDELLAVEPLSHRPTDTTGMWHHEFGAACAVGACSVVVTRQVAAWIFTGEDD